MPAKLHEFETGDIVTPVTEIRGITFPIGVEGVITTISTKGCITVGVKHKDAYPGSDGSSGFAPEYVHRYSVWHDKTRLVRRL
ncbi:MAG: hypothetical protein RJB39_493 [Candidatus Parcubacteria bacterium]|jgi:hypothetical protein